ncbi:uncharacterized protein LOC110717995 [Chenopodium quinoa]|uniref:uncharacterized protein LOC110717995 n=1 Tax=Chenopodium quinoa TaxID=63459 RepID=UPI000B787492|nr:uncharacterized protein LOC110717995 [Chenopodium quinoa]
MSKEIIHGGYGEAYSVLPRYAKMVKQNNLGSYALVTWGEATETEPPRFKGCFFSFAAQVRGFLRGCRPFIGIDEAHLSGHFKGILLTVVGIDGNNEIFLIAYGVVGSKSIDSWGYFLRNLRCLFEKEGCRRDDWTFISDRIKGVDTAIYETFPRATRRVCFQHLYMNCKANGFSGSAFHKLFWIAADAYNEYVFNKAMQKIEEYNPKAIEYLESCTEVWSRHKFHPTLCCDHNTTNFVESFNSCTKPYRDLPVLKILEDKILQTRSDESRFCYAIPCGGDEFERLQPADFVAPCFKGKAYKLTYAEHMHHMPDPSQWPSRNLPDILPPLVKRGVGRLKKQRKRGPNEARKGKRHATVKCSLCSELGHNKLTCASRKKRATTEASTSATSSQAKKRTKRAA